MKCLFGRMSALVVCFGAVFAAAAPASAGAQQSWLYPPEVAFRPVVVVDDPILQRRYWDPRFCDCACLPHWHASCVRPGAWR